MNKYFAAIAATTILLQPVMITVASAQPSGRIERVQFPKNSTSTIIKGQVKGDLFVDYRVRASAGQTLAVTLKPNNLQNYFNINPPSSDVSMFVGSSAGNSFKGMLPTDGDYTVRVYLLPAAMSQATTA